MKLIRVVYEFLKEHLSFFICWHPVKTNKMVEKGEVHDIFLINPIDSLSFVGRYVKLVLENGEKIFGTVYTIDPVSQSVVLIHKDISEELSLKIIMKHSINSMEISLEVPIKQQNLDVSNIFKVNQFSSEGNSKKDVMNWLNKNMIPVQEMDDKLVIDSLEIHPPYGVDHCYSSNPIVLSRIQSLLRQMPSKHS